jgi:hypothetical protein
MRLSGAAVALATIALATIALGASGALAADAAALGASEDARLADVKIRGKHPCQIEPAGVARDDVASTTTRATDAWPRRAR